MDRSFLYRTDVNYDATVQLLRELCNDIDNLKARISRLEGTVRV